MTEINYRRLDRQPKKRNPIAKDLSDRELLPKIIGNKIIKANADECKEVTGFSIGGVPPVAHIHSPSRIFIDEKLNRFNKVYAAAGHPYVVFEITFEQLCQISKGNIVDFIE